MTYTTLKKVVKEKLDALAKKKGYGEIEWKQIDILEQIQMRINILGPSPGKGTRINITGSYLAFICKELDAMSIPYTIFSLLNRGNATNRPYVRVCRASVYLLISFE